MSKTTRLLSLILVIAMAFSLVVSGASAAWADDAAKLSDYDTVNYQEAAKVLTYLNIIDGIDGAFKPEGNLQRDQAAKIVTLVVTAANDKTADTDQIAPTNTEFADVPKSHWASGYIQWAYKNNIVSGKGIKGDPSNEYRPTETVTVLQFQKMLLTGLGYGANGEFEGQGWDTATFVKATELGLWGSVDPVTTDRPATREEAMEFALQALKKAPVHYAFNAYAVGSLLNVNSYDERPLYKRHGLALDEGVDKIGYLMYKWVDAKTNALVYEGYEKAYKEILVSPNTKRADFESGIVGNATYESYITGGGKVMTNSIDMWMNGYQVDTTATSGAGGWTVTTVELKDANGVGTGIWISNITPTTPTLSAIGYKNLFDYFTGLDGAKVTLYVEERVLVHVTVEIQVFATVSNVKDASKTFTATIKDSWLNRAYYTGIAYTGVDLDGAEYKDKQYITVVPQFSGELRISTDYSGVYAKKVLKTYETKVATTFSGVRLEQPARLLFGTSSTFESHTWIGSANHLEVWMNYGYAGGYASGYSFYTDSNNFVVYAELVSSALPDKYAVAQNIVLIRDKNNGTDIDNKLKAGLFPALYEYLTMNMYGEYLSVGSEFTIKDGNWKKLSTNSIRTAFFGNAFVAFNPFDFSPYDWPWDAKLIGRIDADPKYWTLGVTALVDEGDGISFLIDTVHNSSTRSTVTFGVAPSATEPSKTTWKIATDCVVIINGYHAEYGSVWTDDQLSFLTDADAWAWSFYETSAGEIGAILLDIAPKTEITSLGKFGFNNGIAIEDSVGVKGTTTTVDPTLLDASTSTSYPATTAVYTASMTESFKALERATGNTMYFDLTFKANPGYVFADSVIAGFYDVNYVFDAIKGYLGTQLGGSASLLSSTDIGSTLVDLSTKAATDVYIENRNSADLSYTFRVYYKGPYVPTVLKKTIFATSAENSSINGQQQDLVHKYPKAAIELATDPFGIYKGTLDITGTIIVGGTGEFDLPYGVFGQPKDPTDVSRKFSYVEIWGLLDPLITKWEDVEVGGVIVKMPTYDPATTVTIKQRNDAITAFYTDSQIDDDPALYHNDADWQKIKDYTAVLNDSYQLLIFNGSPTRYITLDVEKTSTTEGVASEHFVIIIDYKQAEIVNKSAN